MKKKRSGSCDYFGFLWKSALLVVMVGLLSEHVHGEASETARDLK